MQTNFKVHVTSDRAFIKVFDRASYLNCAPLRKFFEDQEKLGLKRFILDFQDCSSMDSTFLGILVRVALNIRKNSDGGAMVLLNLSGRNLETVCNLGIHQITEVGSHSISEFNETASLNQNLGNSQASSETILQAHKSLMKLNQRNHKVFADVVNFLEQNKGD